MGRKRLDHVRLVAYVPKEFEKQIREEAKKLGLPLGKLIEEAFSVKVVVTKK